MAKQKANKPKLNLKQEEFCQLYVGEDFFGNGVQVYCKVYGLNYDNPKDNRTARANACRLLTNANILSRIDELLTDIGFNDAHADKQLFIAMTQNGDMASKVKAIDQYNKLRSRLEKKKKVEKTVRKIVIEEKKRDED